MTKSNRVGQQMSSSLKVYGRTQIPSWFLEDHVKTLDELRNKATALVIRDAKASDGQAVGSDLNEDTYEMDAAFFESMCSIVWAKALGTETPKSANNQSNGMHLTKNAMLLHYLNRSSWDNYGWKFLGSVVEHFAINIGADMVTFTLDILKALALFYAGQEGEGPTNINDLMKFVFPDNNSKPISLGDDCIDCMEKLGYSNPDHNLPFRELFSSPLIKRRRSLRDMPQGKWRPLVVHLPKISILHEAMNGAVLRSLRSAAFETSQPHSATNIIFIATDIENPLTSLNPSIISMIGSNPVPKALRLVPVNSKAQKSLLVKHGDYKDPGSSRVHRLANIIALKCAVKRQFSEVLGSSLIDSEDDWAFLDNTRAGKIFDDGFLASADINDIVQGMGGNIDNTSIENSILRAGRREEILDAWKLEPSDGGEPTGETSLPEKWSSFTPSIKKVINAILGDKEKYKREAEFLDLVVNPEEVEDGWDDIALDQDTKEAIQQILPGMQKVPQKQPDYGILKRGRIGGALLYGPPGTGKTHLARVIARECKAVTICASGADIEDMYVGETEKIIKSLFNLGKMLVPSIIFIDEADALFRARQPGERSWKRSQTNQLLSEMDGLSRSKSAPFVLLATNFPNDLDHALLRRVPSRIYIGLPATVLRERILSIMLKGETLGPDLDVSRLASMTHRFSGSDIQSLCVQAALICDKFMDEGDQKGRRVLGQSHFAKALKRVSPTTSKRALILIRQFACEFDPPGYARLLAMDNSEGGAWSGAGRDDLSHMAPSQLSI